MTKKLLWALILICICVILIVVNRDSMSLDLVVTQVRMAESFALLGFTAMGVAIGLLLK